MTSIWAAEEQESFVESRYAPFSSALDAIVTWEEEGVADIDEAIAVARAILESNLHLSAGRYGRFVAEVANHLAAAEEV
jgi:hypothetical protein